MQVFTEMTFGSFTWVRSFLLNIEFNIVIINCVNFYPDLSLPEVTNIEAPGFGTTEAREKDNSSTTTQSLPSSHRRLFHDQTDNGTLNLSMDFVGLHDDFSDDLSSKLSMLSKETRDYLLTESKKTLDLMRSTKDKLSNLLTESYGWENSNGGSTNPQGENDFDIENSSHAKYITSSTLNRQVKRLEIQFQDLENRLIEQENGFERFLEAKDEEIIVFCENKIAQHFAALEKNISASFERQKLDLETTASSIESRLAQKFEEQIRALALAMERSEKTREERENEKKHESEQLNKKRSTEMKEMERTVDSLKKDIRNIRDLWNSSVQEEEEQLEEFSQTLQQTMESADALGSLMEQYFTQNDYHADEAGAPGMSEEKDDDDDDDDHNEEKGSEEEEDQLEDNGDDDDSEEEEEEEEGEFRENGF